MYNLGVQRLWLHHFWKHMFEVWTECSIWKFFKKGLRTGIWSCTITSSNHDGSLNFGESITKDSRESSKADTDEHISSNEILSRRIAKFSTFYGRIDPEGKESGISHADEEVSSFFERESEKKTWYCNSGWWHTFPRFCWSFYKILY